MAGFGPLAGILNSPYGQYGSLFLSLLTGLDANRQSEEARGQQEEQARGVLDLYHAVGGRDTSGYRPTSFGGHRIGLPYDAMGEARQYGTDIEALLQGNQRQTENAFNRYRQDILNRTQSLSNRLMGAYDQGAGGLLDYAGGRRDAVMGLLERGYGDVQSRLGDRTRDTMGMLASRSDQALRGYANAFQDSYGQLQRRYERGMANLEGAGEQERRDIDTAYGAQAGQIASDLASRGLGNTTVRQSLLQGNLREKTDAQGRLNERLRQERLATDAALSGDVAAAKGADAINWSNLISGLRGDEANAYSALRGDEASAAAASTGALGGAYSGLTGDYQNTLAGTTTNRMNLLSSLLQQQLGTYGSLGAQRMGIQSGGRDALLNWRIGQGANLQNIGQGANAGYINALVGANVQQPDNTWLQVASNLGQGIGSANYTNYMTDVMNQQRRPETLLTSSLMGGVGGALTGGLMSPVGAIAGLPGAYGVNAINNWSQGIANPFTTGGRGIFSVYGAN